MTSYIGLDVSLREIAVCILEEDGRVRFEGCVPTQPEAIVRCLRDRAADAKRIGMESAALQQAANKGGRRAAHPGGPIPADTHKFGQAARVGDWSDSGPALSRCRGSRATRALPRDAARPSCAIRPDRQDGPQRHMHAASSQASQANGGAFPPPVAM
jgi:hypothetical protein